MERASTSTASSSSSSPAAPLREAFPAALMGKRVQLIVRNRGISMLGTVTFAAEEVCVCLKVVRPKNPGLQVGQSAMLMAEDGYLWSGTIVWVENEYPDPDAPGFFDFVGGSIRRQHHVTILCIPFRFLFFISFVLAARSIGLTALGCHIFRMKEIATCLLFVPERVFLFSTLIFQEFMFASKFLALED
jgi:hypothetical protein